MVPTFAVLARSAYRVGASRTYRADRQGLHIESRKRYIDKKVDMPFRLDMPSARCAVPARYVPSEQEASTVTLRVPPSPKGEGSRAPTYAIDVFLLTYFIFYDIMISITKQRIWKYDRNK